MHERDVIWYSVRAGLHMKVVGERAARNKVTKYLSTHVHVNEVALNLHVQAPRGRAMAMSAESHRAVKHTERTRQDACACAHWVKTGVLCVCHTSPRVCACACVCVCDQHVSPVCMSASVSQALVSLCPCVISPELAALKHQRETSALCIYRLV